MNWMHPFTPVNVGDWYWVRTPRGRRFIEQAKSVEHFVSGYVGCAIAGPVPDPEHVVCSCTPCIAEGRA